MYDGNVSSENGMRKGFGFVQMSSKAQAGMAMKELNGTKPFKAQKKSGDV